MHIVGTKWTFNRLKINLENEENKVSWIPIIFATMISCIYDFDITVPLIKLVSIAFNKLNSKL